MESTKDSAKSALEVSKRNLVRASDPSISSTASLLLIGGSIAQALHAIAIALMKEE